MKKRINHSGFTMLEVIAVLVIMGIIAIVAVSRMASNENNIITTTDTLTSQIRLVQSRAMNMSTDTGSVWGIRFISTTQYHMFYCATASTCDPNNTANQIAFPDADGIIMDITGSRVQVTNGAGIIAFDRFGTPYTNATITTILSNPLTLRLRDNNGRTRSINITPQTGMITS